MKGAGEGSVAIVCREGSLLSLGRRLEARGWKVLRIASIRSRPVPFRGIPPWLARSPPADLWLVTSRSIVDPVLRARPAWLPHLREIPRTFAVGADTGRALRSLGLESVRAAPLGGTRDLLRNVGRLRGRRVLYLRSDRAGPSLARELRARGARVTDRVVYRVRPETLRGERARRRLRSAAVWVVSSPSALEGLERVLGSRAFSDRVRSVRGFALGPRTAAAWRRAGGRPAATPRESTEEGFTKFLEQALGDASGRPRRRRS